MQEFGQRKFRGPRGEALAQKIQIVVDLIVRIEGLVAVYDRTHHATFKALVFNWVEHHIEELHTMMRNYRETTKTEILCDAPWTSYGVSLARILFK